MYVGGASIFLCEKADILLTDRLEVEKKIYIVCVRVHAHACVRVCLLKQASTLGQYVID